MLTLPAHLPLIDGDVFAPGDAGWDAARAAWNLAFDQRPELVAVPRSIDDVRTIVAHAREHGLRVAMQGTGHNAGAVWDDVVQPASELGLAPLAGSSPDVGMVGYSLGGGIGWMARKRGLAANSVTAIELVTGLGRPALRPRAPRPGPRRPRAARAVRGVGRPRRPRARLTWTAAKPQLRPCAPRSPPRARGGERSPRA